jgi:hypothetical protein
MSVSEFREYARVIAAVVFIFMWGVGGWMAMELAGNMEPGMYSRVIFVICLVISIAYLVIRRVRLSSDDALYLTKLRALKIPIYAAMAVAVYLVFKLR